MRKKGAESRRKNIIEAAKKIFFKNGYEKTSVDMIADSINVAKGTIYLYFKSKQKIFVAVAMDMLDRFEAVIEEGKNNPEEDYITKLKALISSTLGYVEANEEFFNIWMKQFKNLGKTFTRVQHNKIMEKHHRIMKMLSEVVQEGINKGVIRKVNAEVAGVVLLNMVTTFSRLDLFSTNNRILNKKSSEIMDMFLKGVGK